METRLHSQMLCSISLLCNYLRSVKSQFTLNDSALVSISNRYLKAIIIRFPIEL